MRFLIATEAWHPQVNGVVRTLTSLARAAATLGSDVAFLTPDGFPSAGGPTHPGPPWRRPPPSPAARGPAEEAGDPPRGIEAPPPGAIHIATEGPIGWWVRAWCR